MFSYGALYPFRYNSKGNYMPSCILVCPKGVRCRFSYLCALLVFGLSYVVSFYNSSSCDLSSLSRAIHLIYFKAFSLIILHALFGPSLRFFVCVMDVYYSRLRNIRVYSPYTTHHLLYFGLWCGKNKTPQGVYVYSYVKHFRGSQDAPSVFFKPSFLFIRGFRNVKPNIVITFLVQIFFYFLKLCYPVTYYKGLKPFLHKHCGKICNQLVALFIFCQICKNARPCFYCICPVKPKRERS